MNRIPFLLLVLTAANLACGLPLTLSATPVVVTQVIVVPNVIEATPTPTATIAATFTLVPTETALSTPTATPTATLSGPVATFIKNANCRQGPGTNYDSVASFLTGQTVEIVGRNQDFDNTWWYVKIPDSNGKCWVSLTTAQAYGDFDDIPIVKP